MAVAQMKWQSLDAIAGQLADLRLDLQRTWWMPTPANRRCAQPSSGLTA